MCVCGVCVCLCLRTYVCVCFYVCVCEYVTIFHSTLARYILAWEQFGSRCKSWVKADMASGRQLGRRRGRVKVAGEGEGRREGGEEKGRSAQD